MDLLDWIYDAWLINLQNETISSMVHLLAGLG
jgi:hypothetical protein